METFTKIECCNCGVIFKVSSRLDKNWLETKKTFYCPNGHGQSYTKSTSDTLREQLSKKESEIFEKNNRILNLESENKKLLKKERPMTAFEKREAKKLDKFFAGGKKIVIKKKK